MSYHQQDFSDDFAQQEPQPLEDEAKVVAHSTDDGVDLVAEAALQEVSVEMAITFAMADHRFDGTSPFQFLFDLAKDTALLAGLEDA